jgi:uncharacterized membrane protein
MPQRVEGSIEIAVPVEEVYGYWETLENLPYFMANVEDVIPTGPDTTRWRVKGPFGRSLEWEARTTHKEPNSTIGWITNSGADVDNAGVVRFREAVPGVTLVEVVLDYADPPGGRIGELASRVVADPQLQLGQDLRNLKDVLEGRATPEEIQQRPAAATVQSGAMAFLAGGAGLLLIGVGVLAFFLLHRRGDRSEGKGALLSEGGRGGKDSGSGKEQFVGEISKRGRIAHDLGLSTWFGGTLFGQLSLNPAVSSISDQRERGRVLNEAWARFQAANIPAMLSTLLGWRLGGVRDDAQLRAPGLTRAKDLLLGGAAFNTVASALLGASTAASSRGGATPVRSGTKPSRQTPPEAALAVRLLRFTGNGSLALLAATVVVSALIEAAEPKPRGLLSRFLSD